MSADPPIVAVEEIAAMVEEEEMPLLVKSDASAGMSEPTLRELVQKLRTEPWATPEGGPTVPLSPPLDPTLAAGQPQVDEAQASIFERHVTKFPLGGVTPEKEAEKPVDKADAPDDPQKPPRTGKPLP